MNQLCLASIIIDGSIANSFLVPTIGVSPEGAIALRDGLRGTFGDSVYVVVSAVEGAQSLDDISNQMISPYIVQDS